MFLRTIVGCRHRDTIREHREQGWHWVCSHCGYAALMNPRDRAEPKATGRYDEWKAIAGKARAEKVALQRRAIAARLCEGMRGYRPQPTTLLQLKQAK